MFELGPDLGLDFDEAIRRARSDSQIAGLHGYFLASAFSITEEGKNICEWTLLFYNAREKKTMDCFVNNGVTVGQELPAQKEMKELKTGDVKVSLAEAMKIAIERCRKKTINILISLHAADAGHPVWTITMVGADITATVFDVDAASGKIIREETINLMRKEK